MPVNQFLSLVELLVSLPSSLLPIGTALRYHQQSIPIIILTTRFSTIFLARIGRIGDGRQHPEEEEVRLRQHGQPCQGRAQEEGGEGGRGDAIFHRSHLREMQQDVLEYWAECYSSFDSTWLVAEIF